MATVTDSQLGENVQRLFMTMRCYIHSQQAPSNFRGRWRIIHCLAIHGELPQRDLASRVHMQPGSLTEALEHLEADKKVVRQRDTSDHRIVNVKLTAAGRQEERMMRAHSQRFERELFSALTDSERQSLMTITEKLITQLYEMKGAKDR